MFFNIPAALMPLYAAFLATGGLGVSRIPFWDIVSRVIAAG
jgi:hypothetical protein